VHIKAYPLSHTHTVQAQGKQQELMKPLELSMCLQGLHTHAYTHAHAHAHIRTQAQGKQQELMKPLAEHVPARPTHTHTYTHSHTHMHSHMLMLMHTSAHRHRVGSRS